MKILLTSIGTRGDIEPFLAVGEVLRRRGHYIIYSFPQQFESIVKQDDDFRPLSKKVIQLIESRDGRIVMGKANFLNKIMALFRLYKKSIKVNQILMRQQFNIIENENPDLIIHNVKCNYPLIWSLKYNSKQTVLISPVPYFMYYAKGHSHIGFNKDFGSYLNKLTYKLSNYGLVKTIYDAQKFLPKITKFKKKDIKKQLFQKKLIYTISPSLFQRPDYWPNNVQVLGHHERDKINEWSPDSSLLKFLNKFPKVLFITFGSMVNSHPEENSKLIYQVLDDLKIPTIINTASGGLMTLEDYQNREHLHFVDQIPYEWILPRVQAMVHHGGSGTTHLALKYACPTLILPHIIDQFGWNSLISELGAGPKGISINKLSRKKLEPLIVDLIQNSEYSLKTKELSKQMINEEYEERLCNFILGNIKEQVYTI